MKFRTFNLTKLLKKLHSFYNIVTLKKGIKLLEELDLGIFDVFIEGDKQRLFQILRILIYNAIKYTI